MRRRRGETFCSAEVKKVEIRPTLSADYSYSFGETADFNVKVGSATSVEKAKPPLPDAKLSPPIKRNEIAEAAGQEAASWLEKQKERK